MKNFTLSIFLFLTLVLSLQFLPVVAFAQSGLVPCGTEIEIEKDSSGKEIDRHIVNPCGFKDLFTLANTIINYVFRFLVVPIAAIMFAYAGFLMLFSGGNAGKSEKAKGIFINVFIGLVIAAAAWLIIHEVLVIVGFNGKAFGLE